MNSEAATDTFSNTLPPQALPSAGFKGFSQLCSQSTPGDEENSRDEE